MTNTKASGYQQSNIYNYNAKIITHFILIDKMGITRENFMEEAEEEDMTTIQEEVINLEERKKAERG